MSELKISLSGTKNFIMFKCNCVLKSLIFKSFLLVISLFLSFLFIEVGLRNFFIFRSDKWAPYYPLGFETAGMNFQFNQREFDTEIEYNSSGFRDGEIPLIKNEIKPRILFVGDSFVEGFGVDLEERFTSVLSDIFIDDVEVINVGQNATGPVSYYLNLTEFGFALHPDVVIVSVFMGNDFMLGRDYEFLDGENYFVKDYLPSKTIVFEGLISIARFEYTRSFVKKWLFEGESISQFLIRRRSYFDFWNYYFRDEIGFNFFVRRSSLSEQEVRIWLDELEPTVREDFLNGMINPGFGLQALSSRVQDLSNSVYYSEGDFKGVCRILDLIDSTAYTRSTKLVLLSLPALYQIDPAYHLNHLKSDFGFDTIPRQLYQLQEMNDRFLHYIEEETRFSIIDMRSHLEKEDFYLFDEHLKPSGHRKVAVQLKRHLEEVLFPK